MQRPSEYVEIWFEDEARIGQKNGQVRQWARRGTRPRQPADQRYDNAYLFGAICPARGVGAALALPYADADMMQLHLDEISRNVAAGAHAVLLLDRAGWHTTSNVWPGPVCKGFYRDRRIISLLQRIRPRMLSPGQDGDTRVLVLISLPASSAVF